MKKALVLAVALSLSASVVSAGGPIIVEDDAPVEVVTTEKPRSGALLPLIAGLVILGALASSGNGSGSGS